MKKIKYFIIFILLIFMMFSYAFINTKAFEETYEIDGVEYTVSYEENSATGGPKILDAEGVILFSEGEITITCGDESYTIYTSNYEEESSFEFSDFYLLREFYQYKDQILNNVLDPSYVGVTEAQSSFKEEYDYLYYDVSTSLEENKMIINDYYKNVFVHFAIMELYDNYDYLNRDNINTLERIAYVYNELPSIEDPDNMGLDGCVIEYGYETYDDLYADFNYKVSFSESIESAMMMLEESVYAHDSSEIYDVISEYSLQLADLSYEQCFSEAYLYYDDLMASLEGIVDMGIDAVKLFQAKERFENYFNEFLINNKDLYKEEDFEDIRNYVEHAIKSVEGLESKDEVDNLKYEVLEYIKTFNVLSIDTSNGSITSENGIDSGAILYIDQLEQTDNVTTYDIGLYGVNEEDLENNSYTISIYDVQTKYIDIEVYREYNGSKVKLHSEYVNNVLTIDTDTLGTIYVVGVKKAPWGEMAIVFGCLFVVLFGVIIFFNVGDKNEKRVR